MDVAARLKYSSTAHETQTKTQRDLEFQEFTETPEVTALDTARLYARVP
jgi:hypothetical protein